MADLDPVQMSVLWFVHYVPTAVKAKDVVTNTACPARFLFVLMAEQFLSRQSSTVVKVTMCEDPQQSTLAGIHVSYHGHPRGNIVSDSSF